MRFITIVGLILLIDIIWTRTNNYNVVSLSLSLPPILPRSSLSSDYCYHNCLSSPSTNVIQHSCRISFRGNYNNNNNAESRFLLSFGGLSSKTVDDDDLVKKLIDDTTESNNNNNKKRKKTKINDFPREKRILELKDAEERRAIQVRQDALPYLGLLGLQFLPLIFGNNERFVAVLYFLGVAISTVYLGGRQEVIDNPQLVSKKNALLAPIGASISLFLLYVMIKNGVDPTLLYALAVSFIGSIALSDIGVPILENIFQLGSGGGGGSAAVAQDWTKKKKEVRLPKKLVEFLDLESSTVSLVGVYSFIVGLTFTAIYWAPIDMTQKFIVSNVIAWAIAMTSLSSITLGSFQTGAILLFGLFAYDIFWVFRTDVMMTVALKVEAPVKFLYTAPSPAAVAATAAATDVVLPRDNDYPFSVLGLGDVVIPGIFVRFMGKIDEVLKPRQFSYFTAATAAYAFGLATCFVANEVTHLGQPALLYLDPACIGSALACGVANGQLEDVWNFQLDNDDEDDGEATT